MVRKIDKKQYTMIAQRIANGETLQSVATDLGVSRERVRQIARDADVHPRQLNTASRDALIASQALKIVEEREWWVPSRFPERGFTKKQFDAWLVENQPELHDRWIRAQELPLSTGGAANPNGRLCLMCGKRKPWEQFYNDKNGINGHAQKCITCARAEVEHYRKLRSVPVPTVKEKRCSGCGVVKEAALFSRLTTATSGLQSQCKECQR